MLKIKNIVNLGIIVIIQDNIEVLRIAYIMKSIVYRYFFIITIIIMIIIIMIIILS